jgi:RND family efflux transporter MFP subunit
MNKKIVYPLAVLAIGLAVATLLATTKPERVITPSTPAPTTVRVSKVSAASEYLTISSQGTVQPRSQGELIPEVSGRVVWLSQSLVDGGSFKAGEVLLRIDDADYRTTLQRASAAQQRAEVEQSYAEDELVRLQQLFRKKLASQSQMDSAQRASRIADANLADSRAALDQAERDLARTELIAPFDGLVRSEKADQGQFVSRGNSIGTIYATDYMEVRLPIAADQLAYLGLPRYAQGQIEEEFRPPVTVTADFGQVKLLWEGELVRTEAAIDERSRMIYGVSRLDNNTMADLPIPVGLFVQAEIRGRKVDNVVRLPRSALRDNNQILVVDADNRLRFRRVSILRLEHDDVLIHDGLTDGEMVCISPLQTVVEGMSVTPVTE